MELSTGKHFLNNLYYLNFNCHKPSVLVFKQLKTKKFCTVKTHHLNTYLFSVKSIKIYVVLTSKQKKIRKVHKSCTPNEKQM